VFAVVLCLVLAVAPGARAADRDDLAAFLEVTGFGVALDSIALSAEDAPAMLGLSTSDFGKAWSRAVAEVFDSAAMRETALDILAQTLRQPALDHAVAFDASPLGERLVAAENDAHMMADDAEKRTVGAALFARAVEEDPARVQILKDLIAAVDGRGMAVRAAQEIRVRYLMAASHAGVLDQRLDEAALRAMMADAEDELRQRLRRATLVGAAYTYRDFPNDEMRVYVHALEDPRMQEVYELMQAVHYEITAERFEALALRMADLAPSRDL
jgi:hypothetical protein